MRHIHSRQASSDLAGPIHAGNLVKKAHKLALGFLQTPGNGLSDGSVRLQGAREWLTRYLGAFSVKTIQGAKNGAYSEKRHSEAQFACILASDTCRKVVVGAKLAQVGEQGACFTSWLRVSLRTKSAGHRTHAAADQERCYSFSPAHGVSGAQHTLVQDFMAIFEGQEY